MIRLFLIAEESPHHTGTLEGHTARVSSVSFSLDGTLASGSRDGTVKLWDVGAIQNIATLMHGDWVEAVSFSPDGTTLASGGNRGTLKLWDVTTQQEITTLEGHNNWVNSVSFSPDGRTLASGAGGYTASGEAVKSMVKLWDVTTGVEFATLLHEGFVTAVSFSDTGMLASGSGDGTVKLWDVTSQQNIATLPRENIIHSVPFYPDILSVSFSPDGTILASGGRAGIELWDVATRQNIGTLTHGGTVSSVSFFDEETLASGGGDRTVKLWDMTTRASFATFPHTSVIDSVSFSPEGGTLASGTSGGTVELWDMSGLMGVRLEALAEVDIPDPNLRAAIVEAIGLPPSTPIVRGHLENLTDLEANNANISDLTGLEAATKLRSLLLEKNNISDFSAIAGLTNLKRLGLGSNSISDISAIAGLTNLTNLTLWDNNISDISAVAGLTNLKKLGLRSNSISDISAVSGLTNLQTLNLGGNSVSDISAVSGLTNLQTLNLGGNNVSDVSAVVRLTQLTQLNLANNAISDVSPLLALNLAGTSWDSTGLHLEGNPLSYTSIYTHIPAIQAKGVEVKFDNRTATTLLKITGAVSASNNRLTVEVRDSDGRIFEGVPVTFTVTSGGGTLSVTNTTTDKKGRAQSTLTLGKESNRVTVSAVGTEHTVTFSDVAEDGVHIPDPILRAAIGAALDVTPGDPISVEEMATLTHFRAKDWTEGASIGLLTGLEFATNLTELRLGNNSITDISPLSGLTNLTTLNLETNSVTDISPLSGLTNLTNLHLTGNHITDISFLSDLTGLTVLRLEYNRITDISPLSGLTDLTELRLSGNNITDISPLSGLTNLTRLELPSGITDVPVIVRILSRLPHLTSLGLSNSNIEDVSALIPVLSDLTDLRVLNLFGTGMTDLSPLAGLTHLTTLYLGNNSVSDITPLAELTNLTSLNLWGNNISDVSPLLENTGLGSGGWSWVNVQENPLSYQSIHTHIPTLESRGVTVYFDNQAHPALLKISGDNQRRTPGKTLANPFVVEAQDENGLALSGISVNFTVTSGDGMLSVQSPTTNANGRAQSTLTLGQNLGTYTVQASAVEIEVSVTFNAEGTRIPKKLEIISGKDQAGLPGDALEKPFVVEVRDEFDKPLPGVQVTFTVTSGDGTLSATSVTTDSNGRAESILTLGPNPGTNTVTVSVTGSQETRTFNAEGSRIPKKLEIISGDDQAGLPGDALEKPFVVEVRDEFDKPLPGVQVTFTVTSGDGTLSATSVTTDSNGRAESILTLGPNPGTNTVTVSVTGSQETRTFNGEGSRIPKKLEIISGVDQAGLPGDVLEKAFVVEVRDQTDNPLPGVEVTFTVTAGDGTLSEISVTTDSNGRAESILTLGPNPGTNTVTVSVTGSQETRTFNAEGIRIPKTLEIVSGKDQEGLPGEALEKAFVVEVRDQTDKPLPGVEVTFTVTAGGGTVQPEIATTDENGRAESTLTLGSTPGTNTVRVSVEGNTQAVATLTIETVRVFALSIPAGTHLIHIPLAVNQINGEDATIETVGDLYNALGDEVNFIITVGDDGGWKTYLGDISTGTVADAAIEDDTGLIVVMSDAKTLELVGDALGTDSASMISIDVGNNLVGVPLEPDDMSMISDLLVDGVGAIAVSKADGMGFHTIREPGQDGDGPIVGGVGYLVVYIGTEATSIPIVGSAWENSGAVSAAPAVAFDGTHTPVLYVEGGVMDEFNMLARVPELRVTVKNLSTGASLDTVLGTELSATAYSGTFVELSRHAAKAGDVLEIVAHAPNPFVGVRPVPQIVVSAEEVLTSRISLPDLELYEIPSDTELLANYPNPFNPETWIPYQLAEDADVTLTIYDTKGVTVRRLDLGHQLAGYYADRGKAAYWDGRNDNGESVASGLYFYQLGTPSFSHVRRMVILK